MTPRPRQLTDRDRQILQWIGRHGIVTAEQVARRFFARDDTAPGKRAAYRRLAILQQMGLVRRDPTPFWRAPHVLRLTTAGARAGEAGLRPARLVEGDLRHAVAVVDLVETLVQQFPQAELRTERELRSDRMDDRALDDRLVGRGRCPDAALIFPEGKTLAIELDLTPKRSKDFERILRAYRQENFDRVWWYVLPGIVSRVQRIVVENQCDDFVTVKPWSTRDSS